MTECLFCRIVEKKVPCHTVYEDNNVLAFLDIFPHTKGHTVVIPKKHAVVLQDLDVLESAAFIHGIDAAMQRIEKVLSPEGFNVGWNHGDAGGQVVKHLHTHIFPRWSGDGGSSMHAIINNPSGDVSEIAKLFVL